MWAQHFQRFWHLCKASFICISTENFYFFCIFVCVTQLVILFSLWTSGHVVVPEWEWGQHQKLLHYFSVSWVTAWMVDKTVLAIRNKRLCKLLISAWLGWKCCNTHVPLWKYTLTELLKKRESELETTETSWQHTHDLKWTVNFKFYFAVLHEWSPAARFSAL